MQTFEHPAYTPRVELVPRGDLRNAVPMQAQQRKRSLLRRSAFCSSEKKYASESSASQTVSLRP